MTSELPKPGLGWDSIWLGCHISAVTPVLWKLDYSIWTKFGQKSFVSVEVGLTYTEASAYKEMALKSAVNVHTTIWLVELCLPVTEKA